MGLAADGSNAHKIKLDGVQDYSFAPDDADIPIGANVPSGFTEVVPTDELDNSSSTLVPVEEHLQGVLIMPEGCTEDDLTAADELDAAVAEPDSEDYEGVTEEAPTVEVLNGNGEADDEDSDSEEWILPEGVSVEDLSP